MTTQRTKPDVQRALLREAHEGAAIAGEELLDVEPVGRSNKIGVGRFVKVVHIQKAAHQPLNFYGGRKKERKEVNNQ